MDNLHQPTAGDGSPQRKRPTTSAFISTRCTATRASAKTNRHSRASSAAVRIDFRKTNSSSGPTTHKNKDRPMYSLTICFGATSTPWQFLFKEKAKAENAYESVKETIKEGLMVRIVDDYGQTATIGSITGY